MQTFNSMIRWSGPLLNQEPDHDQDRSQNLLMSSLCHMYGAPARTSPQIISLYMHTWKITYVRKINYVHRYNEIKYGNVLSVAPYYVPSISKISLKSVHSFFNFPADTRTGLMNKRYCRVVLLRGNEQESNRHRLMCLPPTFHRIAIAGHRRYEKL